MSAYFFGNKEDAKAFTARFGGRALRADTCVIGKTIYTSPTPCWRVKLNESFATRIEINRDKDKLRLIKDPLYHLR